MKTKSKKVIAPIKIKEEKTANNGKGLINFVKYVKIIHTFLNMKYYRSSKLYIKCLLLFLLHFLIYYLYLINITVFDKNFIFQS